MGATPLHHIASPNAVEMADLLKGKFGDVSALVNLRDKNGITPLHYAATKNSRRMGEWLLNEGADIEARAYMPNAAEAIDMMFPNPMGMLNMLLNKRDLAYTPFRNALRSIGAQKFTSSGSLDRSFAWYRGRKYGFKIFSKSLINLARY